LASSARRSASAWEGAGRPDSGKGKRDRGTVLVIAGARQTPGAAILAATAALRAGAGTLQIATAASVAATT
jgi:ADP-dependent NAD(P)H-hydrate dehydratase